MSRTARALLAWGLLAMLSPGAGAQAPAESARLSVLAERIGKLHAQAASGTLPERGNRAIAEAVARFDRELAQVRPHAAPEAGEQLLLLKLLWSECRPWFVRAAGRETARRVVERVEELAWVAGRAARAVPESPGVAALQGAALAQRLARLHLLRRGGPEEALELAAAEERMKGLVARLRPAAAAHPQAVAELELAENQLQFLLLAAASRDEPRRLSIIARSADHVTESLLRLARAQEGG
ncbi:MAG TPA: hypothetical protein VEA38_26240 [Terriglobales bacterium]|nr:hypothetical protein [Terriglobales bacterium]